MIGKVALTKKELVREYTAGDERWFPLEKVTRTTKCLHLFTDHGI